MLQLATTLRLKYNAYHFVHSGGVGYTSHDFMINYVYRRI